MRPTREEVMNGSTNLLRSLVGAGLLIGSLTGATGSDAATWPERTVRILVPTAPGGSTDTVARSVGDLLSKRWKQPVVIDNRPGADGIIAAQGLLGARDGHTLLFTTHSTVTVVPLLREVPYDPIRDFAPISLVVEDFLSVVVTPSLPVNSLSELVSLARAKPKELNAFAVPGSPHLAYLAFQKRAAIETTFVPYSNQASALTDLSEGRIQIAVTSLAAVLGQVRAGRIKLLAVTNAVRSPAVPDAQTVADAGFPDFTFGGLLGLFAPKETPAELRERIASEVRATLEEPEVKQRLQNVGLVARGTSAAEFAKVLDEQRGKWAAIAHAHGIKPKAAE
jgi:tripartite-type tricarboxylate transporter receptor subunit TctC